jgi:hypothetical protein
MDEGDAQLNVQSPARRILNDSRTGFKPGRKARLTGSGLQMFCSRVTFATPPVNHELDNLEINSVAAESNFGILSAAPLI